MEEEPPPSTCNHRLVMLTLLRGGGGVAFKPPGASLPKLLPKGRQEAEGQDGTEEWPGGNPGSHGEGVYLLYS